MDLKLIKQLISIIENADITHFSIEEEGVKYVIKKQREIQNLSHGANIPVPSIEKTIEKPVEIKTEKGEKKKEKETTSHAICSRFL